MHELPHTSRFRIDPRWWSRGVLAAAGLFAFLFFAAQVRGLKSFWDLLSDAVVRIPDFVDRQIVEYFASVPADQLGYSLLVGGGFGALATALFVLAGETWDWRVFRQPRAWLMVGMGVLMGGLGAQILMIPTRHCTYAPGVDGQQFRLGLVVTALSALLLLVPMWALLRRPSLQQVDRPSGVFRTPGLPYLLLLPSLIFLAIFLYYPAVQIMLVSTKAKIFPLPQERFVCLENYTSLAEDTVYRNSFMTTLYITLFIVLLSLAIALAVAVLASQKVKWAGVYRTLLVWPYAISPVVTGVIFLSMFREGGAGVINWVLDSTVGISPGWLTDRQLAPWVIIAAAVWNLLGFNILFYIAGLQNIPQDLLEAASLDGANRVMRFWRITFPLLSPFTFFLMVTNITYSFYGIYGVVDTLTPRGGPRFGPGGASGATNVLIFKLYKDAFNTGAPAGLGAAQAVILFLMVAGLTLLQFRYIERRVTYEA